MTFQEASVQPPIPPVKPRIGGVFIPVTDIHRARAWHRDMLGLTVGEVLFGHLCCIPIPRLTYENHCLYDPSDDRLLGRGIC